MRQLAVWVFGLMAVVAPAATAQTLTVVELYQAQGCSSCPRANDNVMALMGRTDVLALSFQVTYWDQLGWKDTFASAANTQRQWDYAHAFHRQSVATPQVVINGIRDVWGSNSAELDTAVRAATRPADVVPVTIAGNMVKLGSAHAMHPAQVWLVRYNPNIVQVPIARGENGGRTLPHRNVVVELKLLGDWNGGARVFPLPAATHAGLTTAVIVQSGKGGPVVAAARAS